jgi:predicted phosphodiesterase
MLGGARGVYSAMRRAERRLTGEGRRATADGFNPLHDRALRWLGREDSCEVLVMGHTHCAGLWTREGRLLANPGGCTAERLGYVTLDLRLGRATVYAIEKEREFGLVSASRNHDGWWTLDEQHDR